MRPGLVEQNEPMGRAFEEITDQMRQLIEDQVMFFVATAPSVAGHVNVSPKGYDTLRVLSRKQVAYLDLTGSGSETIAHIRDNGRVTLMFCSFGDTPNIVRLYGNGRVCTHDDPDFEQLSRAFDTSPVDPSRARSVISVDIHRTSTSCGYSVPHMEYAGDRRRLVEWTEKRSDEELAAYRETRNSVSIDGLPALDRRPG